MEAMADLHRDIAFAYTSCALSIMSFGISAVGMRKVYDGLHQALRRSSAAVRGRMARIAAAAAPEKVLLFTMPNASMHHHLNSSIVSAASVTVYHGAAVSGGMCTPSLATWHSVACHGPVAAVCWRPLNMSGPTSHLISCASPVVLKPPRLCSRLCGLGY